MKAIKPTAPCPCGRAAIYQHCCAVYHAGGVAPDAESLMRARYCAYTLGHTDFLRRTWHPDTCPTDLDVVEQPAPRWIGLTVLAAGDLPDGLAWVEFKANYRLAGRLTCLHERSRFTQIDGQWVYLDGDFPT